MPRSAAPSLPVSSPGRHPATRVRAQLALHGGKCRACKVLPTQQPPPAQLAWPCSRPSCWYVQRQPAPASHRCQGSVTSALKLQRSGGAVGWRHQSRSFQGMNKQSRPHALAAERAGMAVRVGCTWLRCMGLGGPVDNQHSWHAAALARHRHWDSGSPAQAMTPSTGTRIPALCWRLPDLMEPRSRRGGALPDPPPHPWSKMLRQSSSWRRRRRRCRQRLRQSANAMPCTCAAR